MKSFLRQLDEAFTRYEQPVNEHHAFNWQSRNKRYRKANR